MQDQPHRSQPGAAASWRYVLPGLAVLVSGVLAVVVYAGFHRLADAVIHLESDIEPGAAPQPTEATGLET